MRVSITHDTMTKGLIFKKTFYRVTMECVLNEEEKHIIKQAGIEKKVIIERGTPADREGESFSDDRIYDVTFHRVMSPDAVVHTLNSPAEAKYYAEALEEAMRDAKYYLELTEKELEGSKDTSFEI